MAINKQSNIYTVVYIVVMVMLVGVALAGTSLALKQKQQNNIKADTMRQILAAIHVTPENNDAIEATFNEYVTSQEIYNSLGEKTGNDAFGVNVSAQIKSSEAERQLPLFICTLKDGSTKYVIPVYGAGLWGPIWGYLALNEDGSTVYGAYFAHAGETPGLGAEIESEAFTKQFESKQMVKGDEFLPIEVVKMGSKPSNANSDYVDGISGGTITSKGVSDMLANCLSPYRNILLNLNKK